MAEKAVSPAVRKRQQITKANQIMFLSIAGVSVIVGFSIVLIIFLVQYIWFHEKVIVEKLKTVAVLERNLEEAPKLKDNVRELNTNEDLRKTRLDESDSALQSVLDALPADANSAAMAASLQTKLLSGVPGVAIESIKVQPVGGLETDDKASSSSRKSSRSSSNSINFSFSVSTSTNQDGLRQVLTQIEKSIRPFTIKILNVETQGSRVVMSAQGVGYYLPGQKVELKEKVVRP